MEFNDRGFARVSKFGGGSSFDKRRYVGKSQIMDVLNRKDYLNDSKWEMLHNSGTKLSKIRFYPEDDFLI